MIYFNFLLLQVGQKWELDGGSAAAERRRVLRRRHGGEGAGWIGGGHRCHWQVS
jgi:hypothetical protein